jgi:hypothetical protein
MGDTPNEHGLALFHVGILLGLAIPFFLGGIVASQTNDVPQARTLIQIWAGIALIVLFLLLFGINAWVWDKTKINYIFIFEFNTKHHLDYRQYLEVM